MCLLKDINSNEWQYYLRIDPVRTVKKIYKLYTSNRILYHNFKILNGFYSFYEEVSKIEPKREYKNKETRYGYLITLLLPLDKYYSDSRVIKIACSFMNKIAGKEKGLRYFVFTKKEKKAKKIFIYVYDREIYFETHYKKYKKNHVINKNTGKLTTMDDEEKVILHKKGDVILDKEGQPIKEWFKSTKTRIFCYKDEDFKNWISFFRDCYINVLLRLGTEIKKGFIIRRKNLSKAYNRFQRRIVIANNQIIQYIQDKINYFYEMSLIQELNWESLKMGIEEVEYKKTSLSLKIKDLCDKYRAVFSNEKYEYEGEKYVLSGIRCDLVEKNIYKLKDIFNVELNNLINDRN